MAAERAAEITEAYRQLSDPEQRAAYDQQPAARRAPPPVPPVESSEATGPSERAAPAPEPAPPPGNPSPDPATGGGFGSDRLVRDGFVGKASLDRLREVTATVLDDAEDVRTNGFDVACMTRGRRGLLRRDSPLMICGRFVPLVDAAAIRDAWTTAVRLGRISRELCIFLVGNDLAPRRELSRVIAGLRERLSRVSETRIVIIPVDVHDWTGPVPADIPEAARRILDGLRETA